MQAVPQAQLVPLAQVVPPLLLLLAQALPPLLLPLVQALPLLSLSHHANQPVPAQFRPACSAAPSAPRVARSRPRRRLQAAAAPVRQPARPGPGALWGPLLYQIPMNPA